MSKYLAIEDECAPDARKYFEKDFVKITGNTIKEFKDKSVKKTIREKEITYAVEYTYNGFKLEYSMDEPYYHLSKIEG